MKSFYYKCEDPNFQELPKFVELRRMDDGQWVGLVHRWRPDGTLYEEDPQFFHDTMHGAFKVIKSVFAALSVSKLVKVPRRPEYEAPPEGSKSSFIQERYFNRNYEGNKEVPRKEYDA